MTLHTQHHTGWSLAVDWKPVTFTSTPLPLNRVYLSCWLDCHKKHYTTDFGSGIKHSQSTREDEFRSWISPLYIWLQYYKRTIWPTCCSVTGPVGWIEVAPVTNPVWITRCQGHARYTRSINSVHSWFLPTWPETAEVELGSGKPVSEWIGGQSRDGWYWRSIYREECDDINTISENGREVGRFANSARVFANKSHVIYLFGRYIRRIVMTFPHTSRRRNGRKATANQ